MAEPHRHGDHQVLAELAGQRGGHLDPQLARRIDADGLITAGLARLTVSGQKDAGRRPAVAPLLLGDTGGVEWLRWRHKRFPPAVIDRRRYPAAGERGITNARGPIRRTLPTRGRPWAQAKTGRPA